MPTDDRLEVTPNGDAKPDGGEGDPKPGGEAKPEVKALSRDDIRSEMEESLAPVIQEIGNTMRSFSERLNELGKGHEEPDPEGPARKLLQDPDGTIDARIEEALKTKQGPLYKTIVADRIDQRCRDLASEVDDAFGEGTWSEMFDKEVREMIGRLPPELQMEKGQVEAAVALVRGAKFEDLVKRINPERGTKQPAGPSGYQRLPASRRAPSAPKITDEERAFMERLNQEGAGLSDKLLLKMKELKAEENLNIDAIRAARKSAGSAA